MDPLKTKEVNNKNMFHYSKLLHVLFSFKIGCKKPGVYGTTCDIPCPFACKNNACHIQSGVCFECEPGVHGSYCNLSCTTNCKDNTCHNQNGICFLCKPGWIGIYCQTSNIAHHICYQDINTSVYFYYHLQNICNLF